MVSVPNIGSSITSIGSKICKAPKVIGLNGLLAGVFAVPEIIRTYNAGAKDKNGNPNKDGFHFGDSAIQAPKSAVNFLKWMVVPAALSAIFNPVSLIGCAAVGIGGFLLPSFIPEFGADENEEKPLDSFSAVA